MFKNIIAFFLNNHRFNHTLLAFMLLAGVFAYQEMPKEFFPPITLDKIMITGAYPGAGADALDKMAVSPLEEEVNNITGVEKVESVIRAGYFSTILTLQEGADKNQLFNKVKDAISVARRDMPSDMEEPTALFMEPEIPLIIVNIAGGNGDPKRLIEIAKTLKSRLSEVKNLTKIQIYGESDRQLLITLDSERIRAYGLSPQALSQAIGQLSNIFPIGKIEERGGRHFYLTSFGGEKTEEALLNTLIGVGNKRVFLGDVATVQKGYARGETLSSFNGSPSLSVNVAKAKEGNAMALAKQVKQIAAELDAEYPEVTIGTFSDTSVYIRNRLNTVTSSIFFGLVLVAFAMYLLINKRISLVVTMGIPVAFVISLVVLNAMDESINMISLLGALIAIGVIVDDAIIVAENIQRHIEEGYPPKEAALLGAQEMVAPVIAASLTTVFAFLPMLMLTGEIGMFIKIIPIAISVLILAALIESFIFLPLHCAQLLTPRERELNWTPVLTLYEKIIRLLIHYKKSTLLFFWVGVPLMIVLGFGWMKFQFFPEFDATQVNITGKLPVDTTLEETYAVTLALSQALEAYRDVYHLDTITAIAGFRMNAQGMADGGSNLFHLFVDLHKLRPQNFVDRFITPYFSLDYDESDQIREIQSGEIERRLTQDLAGFKAQYGLEEFDIKGTGAGVVATDLEVAVIAKDDTLASASVQKIRLAMEAIEGVVRIHDDAQRGLAELKLRITPYGRQLGLSEAALHLALSDFFLEAKRGRAMDDDGILELVTVDARRDLLQTLQNFPVTLGDGRIVALDEVAEPIEVSNYEKLKKVGGQKRRTVYADVDGITASEALAQLRPVLDEVAAAPGVKLVLGGEKEKSDQLARQMLMASAVAMFLIFMTLLVEFNAFRLTLMILSVIPLSLLGVILGHAVMGLNLTMPSMIGALGLAGVVVNGGIIMLDFVRGTTTIDTLIARARLRVRPIFLTTITTLVGLSLLVFFPSGQAVVLQPLAVSLGFGLFWGTVLNLVYIPVFYALLNRIKD